MRLAEFIRANIKEIAAEWEKFAGTLIPDEEFSASVLRNSIEELLRKIARDMDQPQSDAQQTRKSEGKTQSKSIVDVSKKHVEDRIKMGLSSRQLISEFRALRASVIRLWQQDRDRADKTDLYDLTRFNEVVDEALTEAGARYSQKMDESRELFLGVLGHDLRNPLSAISGSAELILRAPDHERNAMLARQMLVSVGRMSHMITDLIELTRVRWGNGILIHRAPTDMRELCRKAVMEMQAAYPDRVFTLDVENNLYGEWDELKLIQVLSNLLGNAVQHGSPDSEIIVAAKKTGDEVDLQVHNEGPVIPEKLMPRLFDRFVQGKSGAANGKDRSGSMGLGLYIAKQIVVAHGGTINAHSSKEEGNTFLVCLPRTAPHDSMVKII